MPPLEIKAGDLVSPELKLGLALTGNFGAPLKYDDDWVGCYYVKETTLLGISFLPSLAYKVTNKLSRASTGAYRPSICMAGRSTSISRAGGRSPSGRVATLTARMTTRGPLSWPCTAVGSSEALG